RAASSRGSNQAFQNASRSTGTSAPALKRRSLFPLATKSQRGRPSTARAGSSSRASPEGKKNASSGGNRPMLGEVSLQAPSAGSTARVAKRSHEGSPVRALVRGDIGGEPTMKRADATPLQGRFERGRVFSP